MKSVNLRGSMVEIDPYRDDLFRKVIEQRKLNKSDKAPYYWLKILADGYPFHSPGRHTLWFPFEFSPGDCGLVSQADTHLLANSIYGFFVELNPELQSKNVPVQVFSGEATFSDNTDVLENPGPWFCPPLASLITSGGRLLLAMTEACVEEKRGTYLFCDTDSLAIVSSKKGGSLSVPGSAGIRTLSWEEVREVVDRFTSLSPYDPEAVKGSILNLVDANYLDSNPKKPRRQVYGYSIAAKRYALYEKVGKADIKITDPKAHGIGFLYPPENSPHDWDESVPRWIYQSWDYILRDALKLPRKPLAWLDLRQKMRLTITTYNVLEMLGEWKMARPYNFLLLPMIDSLFGFASPKQSDENIFLVCPFSSKHLSYAQVLR